VTKDEGVCHHPVGPADHPFHEIEETSGIPTGEENGEPGDDHGKEGGYVQEGEHDEVGDSEEPLDQGEPRVQFSGGLGVVDLEVAPTIPAPITITRDVGAIVRSMGRRRYDPPPASRAAPADSHPQVGGLPSSTPRLPTIVDPDVVGAPILVPMRDEEWPRLN
jgi:hypothetical protein